MTLPCYLVKQIFLAYEAQVFASAGHLTETCKLWRNIIHEVLVEESVRIKRGIRLQRYALKYRLTSQILNRDQSLDTIVTIVQYGDRLDRELLRETLPIVTAQQSDVSWLIKDRLIQAWKKWLVVICADADRVDLLNILALCKYDMCEEWIKSSWSAEVQAYFYPKINLDITSWARSVCLFG